jgi:hypothetical protein
MAGVELEDAGDRLDGELVEGVRLLEVAACSGSRRAARISQVR